MWYDFSNPFDCERAKTRLQSLIKKQSPSVEIIEHRQRSGPQNRYLHVCIDIVALETGNTMDYVKVNYFKAHVNPEIFVEESFDKRVGHNVPHFRSSRDLNKEEMTTAITRFRNWASGIGIYIPSPEEEFMLRQAEARIKQNKEFL